MTIRAITYEQLRAAFANEKIAEASTTPAGGGDISPAAVDRSTSLASNSGEATVVVEPPKPEASPAQACSDEIFFDEFAGLADDPEQKTTFSIDSTGRLAISTPYDGTLQLTADYVYQLNEFLMNTATIWGKACKQS